MLFENDSISNIAHQLGYFDAIAHWRTHATIQEAIERVTLDEVAAVAAHRLRPSGQTVGWFEPLPPGAGDQVESGQGAGSGPVSA
jgi:predicted Zn-dependent peptidase